MTNEKSFPRKLGAFFLTFEGPEGSGKSTQVLRLVEHLVSLGKQVVHSREPGGSEFGNAIRGLLLNHSNETLAPETELFMMLAQRKEHLTKLIMPALEKGSLVICDRYLDSSVAYQGHGRGLNPEKIKNLHLEFLGACFPHGTVLIDIQPDKGLERARHKGMKKLDRMENQALDFHSKVRDGYISEAAKEPERFLIVDGSQPEEVVFSDLKNKLNSKFPEIFIC